MTKKNNYGKCKLCGMTGNRNSEGLCYYAKCKAKRAQMAKDAIAAIPDRNDAPEACGLGADLGDSTREEPAVETEESASGGVAAGQGDLKRDPESVKAYMDELGAMLDTVDEAAGQDHSDHGGGVTEMAIDTTRPFSFAGFDFDPIAAAPPPGRPTARLSTSGNFHISSAATKTHGLLRFKYLQVIPDRTGQALALIFSIEATAGARALAAERKSPCAIKASARALARVVPGMVGKTLELRPMGQDGALLAVVGEVAA